MLTVLPIKNTDRFSKTNPDIRQKRQWFEWGLHNHMLCMKHITAANCTFLVLHAHSPFAYDFWQLLGTFISLHCLYPCLFVSTSYCTSLQLLTVIQCLEAKWETAFMFTINPEGKIIQWPCLCSSRSPTELGKLAAIHIIKTWESFLTSHNLTVIFCFPCWARKTTSIKYKV